MSKHTESREALVREMLEVCNIADKHAERDMRAALAVAERRIREVTLREVMRMLERYNFTATGAREHEWTRHIIRKVEDLLTPASTVPVGVPEVPLSERVLAIPCPHCNAPVGKTCQPWGLICAKRISAARSPSSSTEKGRGG